MSTEMSWTQPDPHLSLSLIAEVCPAGRVIDVGGGTSLLAAKLLDHGYSVAVPAVPMFGMTRGKLQSFQYSVFRRILGTASRVC